MAAPALSLYSFSNWVQKEWMVLIDAVARLVPGVLGSAASHDEESVYSGLLE